MPNKIYSEIQDKKIHSQILKDIKNSQYKGVKKLFLREIKEEDAAKQTSLTLIDMGGCNNLNFLRFFPKLKELTLVEGENIDIDGLRYTPDLEEFYAMDIEFKDVSPLENCGKLTILDLISDNSFPLKEFSFLKYLPNLRIADFTGRGVVDLSIFKYNSMLEELVLDDNKISSLIPLLELPKLRYLEVNECGLKNLDGLNQIKTLRYLSAEYNKFDKEQIETIANELSFIQKLSL